MHHLNMVRFVTLTKELFFCDGKRISRKRWEHIDAVTLTKGSFYTKRHGNGWKHGHIAIVAAERKV